MPTGRPLEELLGTITARLTARPSRGIRRHDLVPAAVTLPLVWDGDSLCVLLTVRTADVEHHKGEISFPGGRLDPGDEGPLGAALRETWEEVGIRPEHLRVLGVLDDFVSITGYRVTPHVVYLEQRAYPFRPEPREVAEILLVPLEHLLDPRKHGTSLPTGSPHRIHRFRWGDHVIWGLTAAILKQFLDLGFDCGP